MRRLSGYAAARGSRCGPLTPERFSTDTALLSICMASNASDRATLTAGEGPHLIGQGLQRWNRQSIFELDAR